MKLKRGKYFARQFRNYICTDRCIAYVSFIAFSPSPVRRRTFFSEIIFFYASWKICARQIEIHFPRRVGEINISTLSRCMNVCVCVYLWGIFVYVWMNVVVVFGILHFPKRAASKRAAELKQTQLCTGRALHYCSACKLYYSAGNNGDIVILPPIMHISQSKSMGCSTFAKCDFLPLRILLLRFVSTGYVRVQVYWKWVASTVKFSFITL